MQEVAQPGLDELSSVRLVVDVSHRHQAVRERLLDDRGADLGRDRDARLRHRVDPHLDEVDALPGQLADHLARFFLSGGLLGEGRVEPGRRGEPAAGREHARRVGPTRVGCEHQRDVVAVVGADAPRRGDAEVELRPELLLDRGAVARSSEHACRPAPG